MQNAYNIIQDTKPMKSINCYRAANNLNKRQFCANFNISERDYNRKFQDDGREWAVIMSKKSDKLIEVKAEYVK